MLFRTINSTGMLKDNNSNIYEKINMLKIIEYCKKKYKKIEKHQKNRGVLKKNIKKNKKSIKKTGCI